MNKLVARFFFSLCIFLLSGFGFTYAYTYHDCPYNVFDGENCSNADDGLNVLSLVIRPPSEKEIFKIDVADFKENEEERSETTSSKKNSESGHYLPAIFYYQSLNFFGSGNKSLQFGKNLFYHSSNKWYLIFEIIRI